MDASAAGPPSETRRPVASGRRLDIDVEVPKIQVREFHLDTNAAGIFTSNPRILTLDLPLSGVSKTLGSFNSQITDQGGLGIAAIEDLRITVTRMTGHLRVLLEAMVEQPQAKLGALPMLTAAEREQLLVESLEFAREHLLR